MESLTSYLRSGASFLARAEANWGPLSNIMVLWCPNHLKMFWKKSLPTPAVLMVFEQGIIITPFVRPWSTTTMMESMLPTRGRLVTKSTKSCLNGRVEVDEIGFNGGHVGWVFILFCWQTAHPSMNLLMYVDSPGHQKSLSRKVLVRKWPVWLRVGELCREVMRV